MRELIQVVGENGSGKTHKLMELALENDAIFVCSDADRFAHKAHQYGIYGLRFMSYDEYCNSSAEDLKVVIDDLDKYVRYANNEILGFSLTLEK